MLEGLGMNMHFFLLTEPIDMRVQPAKVWRSTLDNELHRLSSQYVKFGSTRHQYLKGLRSKVRKLGQQWKAIVFERYTVMRFH